MPDKPQPPNVIPYKARGVNHEPTVAQTFGLYIAVFCLAGLLLVIGIAIAAVVLSLLSGHGGIF